MFWIEKKNRYSIRLKHLESEMRLSQPTETNMLFVCVWFCLLFWIDINSLFLLLHLLSFYQRRKSFFSFFDHFSRWLQLLQVQFHWCRFMCKARWSDLEKLLSQWTHLKGLTPVCFRWWRVNSSDLANRHSQPSHEQR